MKSFSLTKCQRRSLVLAFLLGISMVYQLLGIVPSNVGDVQRNLTTLMREWRSKECSKDFPLRCIHEFPEESDTVLYWHIPKNGGTTAKKLYQCMGKTIADKLGMWPQFHHHKTKELTVFKPFRGVKYQTINVDTTTFEGMNRAREMNLVQSHQADIIFTHDISAAMNNLGFDPMNQGRALALFRNPVERLISKFYYLQTAEWESGYRPHWRNMTVLQWAQSQKGAEINYMVQKLSGKGWDDPVTQDDLPFVKQLLRDHIIVGLLSDVEESFRRFNVVINTIARRKEGYLRREELQSRCMKDALSPDGISNEEVLANRNKHDVIPKNSPTWIFLAEKNHLDMQLYEYIEMLFDDQKKIIDFYEDLNSHAAPL